MPRQAWRTLLTAGARRDIDSIGSWTTENFGVRQAGSYLKLIDSALAALKRGPESPRVRKRDEIRPGIYSIDIRPRGKPARHVLLFQIPDAQVIVVLRILHVSMDFERHVPF